ncbi:hypothetical protein Y09_3284 [Brachybacterium sp. SW0106-09]|nr:hypothetical protein Y09_3284 [Brachybacterium sp. SW0106-09]
MIRVASGAEASRKSLIKGTATPAARILATSTPASIWLGA